MLFRDGSEPGELCFCDLQHDARVAVGGFADVVLGGNPDELRYFRRREFVVFREPLCHVGRGFFEGVVQRALQTHGNDGVGGFDAAIAEVRVGDDVDRDLDVHGGFKRVTVHFAIALQSMAVAEVQQRTGVADRQVDGRAFTDLVEVHVAAVGAGVAGGWRSIGGVRSSGDATEHRLHRDGEVFHMFARLFRGRGPVGQVEMPADCLAVIAGLDGKVAVETAIDDVVVTLGPVAVEFEVHNMYDEGVAGVGAGDIKGPGFRVATDDAADAMFVLTSGIDGCGVDGVAGCHLENRLIEG